jgi:hypothetical protein
MMRGFWTHVIPEFTLVAFFLITYGLWHCLLNPTVSMWKVCMVGSHFLYIIGWIFRKVKLGKLSYELRQIKLLSKSNVSFSCSVALVLNVHGQIT